MTRFHFHIVDGVDIPDLIGMECCEAQAKIVAENIARNIAAEVGTRHARKVVVVNEVGSEIHAEAVQNYPGKD
jgi:hypothetical protein